MAKWKPAAGDWKIQGDFAVNSKTGQRLKITHDSAYSIGGVFSNVRKSDINDFVIHYLNSNEIPDVDAMGWTNPAHGEQVMNELDKFITTHGLGQTGTPSDPQSSAFNEYYQDLYSLKEGTGGRAMYDELAGVYGRQADTARAMADVQFQNQALQQAQTVKAISDQVRAERMARLRAGMSEAQIANQDMQMLMANVNTVSQNNMMLNQARLEAQAGQSDARNQAYLSYLEQANARGQNAAAMYATDAGNLNKQVNDYLRQTYGTTEVDKNIRDRALNQYATGTLPKP